MSECNHYWIPSTIDKDGNAVFKSYLGSIVTHVTCKLCNCRTWLNKEQWSKIPATSEPESPRDMKL